MPTNDFKPFATGAGANVMSQADWVALAALVTGFQSGKASSAQVNKALRQSAFIASALAQYTANKTGLDVLDDGDITGFITKMHNAFGADFQPLDATLTALAALTGSANKIPYFSGNDVASLTDLTSIGRNVIGQTSVINLLVYLGLGDINGYVGRKIAEQWITSSRTLTLNPLTKKIKVTITGGGGGGGGAFNSGSAGDNFSGAGGAAGATGIKWFNIADITNFAVVIGAGGTEATKGGDSTFSGVVAVGGNPSSASTTYASGGVGAVGTGADVNLAGGDGGDGQNNTIFVNGYGGSSFWGGGRRAGQCTVSSPRIAKALVPGGGGGGAFDTQVLSTRFYGGDGANGVCLVEEFA